MSLGGKWRRRRPRQGQQWESGVERHDGWRLGGIAESALAAGQSHTTAGWGCGRAWDDDAIAAERARGASMGRELRRVTHLAKARPVYHMGLRPSDSACYRGFGRFCDASLCGNGRGPRTE